PRPLIKYLDHSLMPELNQRVVASHRTVQSDLYPNNHQGLPIQVTQLHSEFALLYYYLESPNHIQHFEELIYEAVTQRIKTPYSFLSVLTYGGLLSTVFQRPYYCTKY